MHVLARAALLLVLGACVSPSARDGSKAAPWIPNVVARWSAPNRTVVFHASTLLRNTKGDLVRILSVVTIPATLGVDSPYFSADYAECEVDIDEELGRSDGAIKTLIRPRPGLMWADVRDKDDVVLETESSS